MRLLSITLVALAVLGVGARPARAGECQTTCASAKRTCQTAAVTAFRSCRADARATSTGRDRRGAVRSCRDTFRAAQQTCVSELGSCLDACGGAPPNTCRGGCARDAVACGRSVLGDARTCLQGCAPGSGRLACVAGCLGQARTAAAACRGSLATCLSGCGSPSGAFVD